MPAERDGREHGSAQSPGSGRDPVRFEWVAEPHGYSVEAAYRVLAGLPPGPVPVKSVAEIEAEFRGEQPPAEPSVPAGGDWGRPPAVAAGDRQPTTADWAAARGPLVAEANALLVAVDQVRRAGSSEQVQEYAALIDAVRVRYTAMLPVRTMSRCPYTGELVRWPLDDVDLDGWFWWYDAPARQLPSVSRTWLAMTGGMRLNSPVTQAPFLCRPGPGAPFVVPSLLYDPQTTAVIVEVPVGPHTGWAITYFGARRPVAHLVNLWGTGRYPVPDGTGAWDGWAKAPDQAVDYDFALEPWLASGQLLWVAPGDAGFELRRGGEGCPYLGLDGPRESPSIQHGVVAYPHPRYRLGT
jgi:hypothetical protein